eukprot:745871-Pleurochrysis_carterae.AAC.3
MGTHPAMPHMSARSGTPIHPDLATPYGKLSRPVPTTMQRQLKDAPIVDEDPETGLSSLVSPSDT